MVACRSRSIKAEATQARGEVHCLNLYHLQDSTRESSEVYLARFVLAIILLRLASRYNSKFAESSHGIVLEDAR